MQTIVNYSTEDYCIMCTVIHYWPLQCLGEATDEHRFFPLGFDLSMSFLMKLKSEAHEGLSLLTQQDRVPPAIICDSAIKLILGEFNRKLKEVSCHLRQTEQFTSWSNAPKKEIKELKNGLCRKLIKLVIPRRLWDDCLKLSPT